MSLLALAYAPETHSAHAAGTGCDGNTCLVYVPIVMVPPPTPELIAPADGAQIVSLAPLLSWTPQITGTYLIQAATDPSFATPAISTTAELLDLQPARHVLDGNLLPTTTYYWRVGLYQASNYLFSPIRRFTTPVKNSAILPPRPELLAPPDQAPLPAREVTVSWRGLPDALYYRVKVQNPDGTLFTSAIIKAPTTTFHVAGLAAGTTYTWKVKALNQYGWGTYPKPRSFTVP
jgi:hypothetical protein